MPPNSFPNHALVDRKNSLGFRPCTPMRPPLRACSRSIAKRLLSGRCQRPNLAPHLRRHWRSTRAPRGEERATYAPNNYLAATMRQRDHDALAHQQRQARDEPEFREARSQIRQALSIRSHRIPIIHTFRYGLMRDVKAAFTYRSNGPIARMKSRELNGMPSQKRGNDRHRHRISMCWSAADCSAGFSFHATPRRDDNAKDAALCVHPSCLPGRKSNWGANFLHEMVCLLRYACAMRGRALAPRSSVRHAWGASRPGADA